MSELIDTTEMYLRTIFELQEEGLPPLRARIAERLEQSGPTVSQTVARMERDGLLHVGSDRNIALTGLGEQLATRVMRKHRLAECMLVDVLGMPWEDVHAEACRWEHVMSDAVERKLHAMLGFPNVSPFGNPIPGLDELDAAESDETIGAGVPLSSFNFYAPEAPKQVIIRRIDEPLQNDAAVLTSLARAGVRPGVIVHVSGTVVGVSIGRSGEMIELTSTLAQHLLVEPVETF